MGYAQHLIRRQELGVFVTTAVVHVLPLLKHFFPRLPNAASLLVWIGITFAWISSPILAGVGTALLALLFALALLRSRRSAEPRQPEATIQNGRIVFFDYFRSCVMLMTVTALWASDFAFFPRKHQKSLMTGLSLLDLGSGSIIYMNGVIAANPRSETRGFRYYTFLCLVGLGLLERFLFGNNPTAEAEYGRDWNIYFVFAGVMLLHRFEYRLFRRNCWVACCGNAIFYELLLIAPILPLGHTPEEYSFCLTRTLNPRNTFVLANLQGLMSTIGFTTISFSSRAIGEIYYKNWSDGQKQIGLLIANAVGIVVYLILSRMGAVIGRFDLLLGIALSDRFEPSRKLASMTYVIYIFCFLNCHSSIFLFAQTHLGLTDVPWLMRLVGSNQLLVFTAATFTVKACESLFNPLDVSAGAAVPLILIYVISCSIIVPLVAVGAARGLFKALKSPPTQQRTLQELV